MVYDATRDVHTSGGSMQEIVGQVLGVTGRTTRNGKTAYDVAFSDGNTYTTFSPQLATQAQQLQGQAVSARVSVTQRGQYTNLNLEAIAPQGQLAPMAMPVQPGTAIPLPTVGVPAQSAAQVAGIPIQQNGRGKDPAVEQRIVRQNVLGTAFAFVGDLFQGTGPEALAEAKEIALGLARELFHIAYYGTAMQDGALPQTEQSVIPAEHTPAAVADAVNGAAEEQVVQQGSMIQW